ncbi:hypothetical protein, partial [Marinitenerispora sediminis]
GTGSAPPPEERPWTVPPAPAEAAAYGGFPEAFGGPAGHRRPVAAEPLNHAIGRPGRPWERARPAGEVAGEVGRLLTGVLSSGPGVPGEPVRELAAALARELAEGFRDCASGAPRLRTAPPATTRCTCSAATSTAAPSGCPWRPRGRARTVGGRTRARRADRTAPPRTRTAAEYRRAGLAVRADRAAVLLGESVWLTDNDRMDVRAWTGPFGRDVDAAVPDSADAAARAWWPESEPRERLLAAERWEEDGDGGPVPRRLDAGTLARSLADFEEHDLAQARSAAWVMGEIGDDDVDDDPQPRFPGDRLVAIPGHDLVGTVTELAAAGSGGARPRAEGIGLPIEECEDAGFRFCLLLVGAACVGAATVDATP